MGGMGGEGGTQSQVISDIIFGRECHGALSHLCCNMYGYNFWKSLNWGFLSHPPPVQPPFYTCETYYVIICIKYILPPLLPTFVSLQNLCILKLPPKMSQAAPPLPPRPRFSPYPFPRPRPESPQTYNCMAASEKLRIFFFFLNKKKV